MYVNVGSRLNTIRIAIEFISNLENLDRSEYPFILRYRMKGLSQNINEGLWQFKISLFVYSRLRLLRAVGLFQFASGTINKITSFQSAILVLL